jgi:hypothetical protein
MKIFEQMRRYDEGLEKLKAATKNGAGNGKSRGCPYKVESQELPEGDGHVPKDREEKTEEEVSEPWQHGSVPVGAGRQGSTRQ